MTRDSEEDSPEHSKSTDATVRVRHHTKICIYSDITITRKQASDYNFENWLLPFVTLSLPG
jgi:hypothetical protein